MSYDEIGGNCDIAQELIGALEEFNSEKFGIKFNELMTDNFESQDKLLIIKRVFSAQDPTLKNAANDRAIGCSENALEVLGIKNFHDNNLEMLHAINISL